MTPLTASRPAYRRRRYIVNRPFQYRMIGMMLLMLLFLTVGALASVWLALRITLQTFGQSQEPLAVAQLSMVAVLVTCTMLLLAAFVVWVGIRLTHKVAGPMVRINAALQQMAQGDFNIHLKLRKGDSFVELADAINTLAASLRARRS